MNGFFPFYDDDNDYNVNSPSFYDYLARQQKLLKKLATRIWEYDKVLAAKLDEINATMTDYMNQWDKNLEELPDDVKNLLVEWLNNGTLEQIINDEVLGYKADKTYVDTLISGLTNDINNFGIDIKKFGVIGDGVTNDTEKIQEALDSGLPIFW